MLTRCLGCMDEYANDLGVCPYCGYDPESKAESSLHMQPGSVLCDRYLIGKTIGSGGFGVTYVAWDNKLQFRVAIKEYLPSEFATRIVGDLMVTVYGGNKAEQFAEGMGRFVDEAKRLAQFQNEAGVVRVFDSFEANNTAYIVMEFIDGETLTSYLEREGVIPAEKAIEMLMPAMRSLEAVHSAGIVHRDIAPDNIMVARDGQVKLIDFGAARHATTSHSRSLTVIIKPGYSPEEQYRSHGEQGAHTDVYAMGGVLYRMVTGITPPDAMERKAIVEKKKKDILLLPSKQVAIDKNIENAILNAMSIEIGERTKSMIDLLTELTSDAPVKRNGKTNGLAVIAAWPLWAKIAAPVGALLLVAAIVFVGHGRGAASKEFVYDEDMVRVPSVINQTVEEAQQKLETQGLSHIIGGRTVSDTVPVNMVLYQSVDAGGVVKKGTTVELYISAERELSTESHTMPDLLYYTETEAADALRKLGADVIIQQEYSSEVAEGIVIRASAETGDVLKEGDTITLYVSKGPDPDTIKTLSVNRRSLSLTVGASGRLKASGGDGTYAWKINNRKVATISSNGTVTAVGVGKTTVTVTSGAESATCLVIVSSAAQPPQQQQQQPDIAISEKLISALKVGRTFRLTLTAMPTPQLINWSTSNSNVVRVSSTGLITAVSPGTATITATATYGTKSYSRTCTVTVIPG